MILHSKSRKRSPVAGFSLLEAVLAIAFTGLVLSAVYGVVAGSIRQKAMSFQSLQLAEVGRTLLEEYVLTRGNYPSSGTYEGYWTWTISEEPHPPLFASDLNDQFAFYEISVTVASVRSPDARRTLSTVMARRANP